MNKDMIALQNIEYIEYAVRDLEKAAPLFEKMGMVHVGSRTDGARQSRLYAQGDIRFVLTASSSEKDAAFQFTRKHGDGVLTIAYRVADSDAAYRLACSKGAEGAHETEVVRGDSGVNQQRS